MSTILGCERTMQAALAFAALFVLGFTTFEASATPDLDFVGLGGATVRWSCNASCSSFFSGQICEIDLAGRNLTAFPSDSQIESLDCKAHVLTMCTSPSALPVLADSPHGMYHPSC